jgi:hypothetical protein
MATDVAGPRVVELLIESPGNKPERIALDQERYTLGPSGS